MNIKKDNAIAGTDMVIAIIAIIIFSTLILTLIYNNSMENVKLKQENLAMIYLTEIFENVGIENYENIPTGEYLDIGANDYEDDGKIEQIVPDDAKNNFKVDVLVTELFDGHEDYEKIIKKVVGTISYNIADKQYSYTMERMKIKE